MNKQKNSELTQLVQSSGVPETEGQKLLNMFVPYFQKMAEIESQINGLNKENPSPLDCKISREIRLALVQTVRSPAKKVKVQCKEMILIKGRLIDALYNTLENTCKPLEFECKQIEEFAEIRERERREGRKEERIKLLTPYFENPELEMQYMDLLNMPDESFDNLLASTKLAYEQKKEAEQKVEADRIKKEKAELEENERIRKENKRLETEAIEKDKLAKTEREKQAKILEKERAKAEAERKKSEEKARIEREKAEKIQADLRAEAEKGRIEIEKIEAEKQEQIEAERKAKLLPDKEKIIEFADFINKIESPIVSSTKAREIMVNAELLLNKTSSYLKEKADKL